MSELISVTCPTCGHEWHEDLDKADAQRVVYKGQTQVEVYVFTCAKDGTKVAVEVEREV